MINAIAIDDEPLALELIKALCNRINYVTLARTFTKPALALEYIAQNPVDLIFLDINMPTISGLEFSEKLPPDTMVIFTTAYSEYAVEGFNLNAVDYLLKPFGMERFEKAVTKAKEYHDFLHHKEPEKQEFLFIKVDYGITQIPLSDITYLEGQDNYVKIHLENGRHHLVRIQMKAIQQLLPENEFIRIHRSYIVPVKKVTSVRNKTATLRALQLPISALYLDDVMKVFHG